MLIFMHMKIFLGTGNSSDSSDGVNPGRVNRSSSDTGSTRDGGQVSSLMESQCN